MQYQFIFSPIALIDYKEAVIWYGIRSKTAAENFILEVENKLKKICADPQKYKNKYKDFRETSLKKYPFLIIYFIDEGKSLVVISRVYHHKRNPISKYNTNI
jgi:plasmid stabilization system protein ParE